MRRTRACKPGISRLGGAAVCLQCPPDPAHCARLEPAMNRPALRLLLTVGFGLALLGAVASARAQAHAGLEQMARDFLQPAVDQALAEQSGVPLRAEVVMGALDSRLPPAPCPAREPSSPPTDPPCG